MNLARLQLAASAIQCGLSQASSGQTEVGLRLIQKGLEALIGVLADIQTEHERAA